MEDEWFIVFLLVVISKKFPSLSIRVWDNDGEFILIEAAYCLPRWINPENSENRVFLRGGDICVLGKRSFPVDKEVGLLEAIRALENGEKDARVSDAVQVSLGKRIMGYPERAKRNMHRARVRVPLPVAQVLKHEPSLISLAVEGFYDRDIDSMKHAGKMDKFLTSDGGVVDMVHLSVRMSRAMYGQLLQQNFQAPRCYPMPSRDAGSVVLMEAELGMKIACGFEMMYQTRRLAMEDGKGTGKGGAWDAFKEKLESSGYFRQLLPGSQEYKRLMHEAEENYKNSDVFVHTCNIFNAPVRRIDEILSSKYSLGDVKNTDISPSDDDSWLYNGEDELNTALLERQKEMDMYELKHKGVSSNHGSSDATSAKVLNDKNIGDMAKSLRGFVEKVSSFEGAEIPQNRDLEEVNFDVDSFFKTLELVGHGSDSDDDFEVDASTSSDTDINADEIHELLNYAKSMEGEAGSDDIFMNSYSDSMKKELESTTLNKSFIRVQKDAAKTGEGTSNTIDGTSEDLSPIDVDLNLVKSFLDSYSSQEGLPGPASNLLGSLGLKLPDDKGKAIQKNMDK